MVGFEKVKERDFYSFKHSNCVTFNRNASSIKIDMKPKPIEILLMKTLHFSDLTLPHEQSKNYLETYITDKCGSFCARN